MPAFDLGEVIRNHVYVRQVYSADENEGGEYLFSSEELHGKLACIYDRLGVEPRSEDELSVVVKLPRNPNPILRGWWHPTTMKKTGEQPIVMRLERLVGCLRNEAVLATKPWIDRFESKPGDEVIISPCVPAPDISYNVR
jgi:hypothetical protein